MNGRKAGPWTLCEDGGWRREGIGEDLNREFVAWVVPNTPVLKDLFKHVFGHADTRKGRWLWTVARCERCPYGDTAALSAEDAKSKADSVLRKRGWELCD